MNLPPRLCSGCRYWRWRYPQRNADGYLEAMCDEQVDPRDKHMKRGSDHCSKWKKSERDDPYSPFY